MAIICYDAFLTGIKNILSNFILTYKTADEFFNQIPKAPDIHKVFEDFRFILYVEFSTDTREYKGAVHYEHCEKHHLKRNTFVITL